MTDSRITSRQVAKWFNKRHDAVIRDIRELGCSAQFKEENFVRVFTRNRNNRPTYYLSMTVKGFLYLILGFTGDSLASRREFYLNYYLRNCEFPAPPVDPVEMEETNCDFVEEKIDE